MCIGFMQCTYWNFTHLVDCLLRNLYNGDAIIQWHIHVSIYVCVPTHIVYWEHVALMCTYPCNVAYIYEHMYTCTMSICIHSSFLKFIYRK